MKIKEFIEKLEDIDTIVVANGTKYAHGIIGASTNPESGHKKKENAIIILFSEDKDKK
jgi:hypothetical protein